MNLLIHLLKAELDRFNLTHLELSRLLGVSPGAVSSWVKGTRKPDASAVRLMMVLILLSNQAPLLFDALVETCRVTRKKPGPVKGSTYIRWRKGRRVKSGSPGSVFASLGIDTRPWYER